VFPFLVHSKSRNSKCCLDSEGTLLTDSSRTLFFKTLLTLMKTMASWRHADCDRLRRRELVDREVDELLRAPVRRAHGVPGARGVRRRATVRAQGELHLRPRCPCRLCPGLPDQSLLVHLLQQTRFRYIYSDYNCYDSTDLAFGLSLRPCLDP